MLFGFLIVDNSGFPFFEYYDKSSDIRPSDFMDHLDTLDEDWMTSEFKTYQIKKIRISDRMNSVIVFKDEQLTDEIEENIIKVSNKAMNGDKVSVQQIINSKNLEGFAFIM